VTVSPERLVCDAIHRVDAHGGVPTDTFLNYSQWTIHKWVGQPNASFRPVTGTVLPAMVQFVTAELSPAGFAYLTAATRGELQREMRFFVVRGEKTTKRC
jgi:hypothetical protein